MSDWVQKTENRIFTIIKTRITKQLSSKYPKLYITSDSTLIKDDQFPSISIEFTSEETGSTTENGIRAIKSSVEIRVYTNKDQGKIVCDDIASLVRSELSDIGYRRISVSPFAGLNSSTGYRVVNASRLYGDSDIS